MKLSFHQTLVPVYMPRFRSQLIRFGIAFDVTVQSMTESLVVLAKEFFPLKYTEGQEIKRLFFEILQIK